MNMEKLILTTLILICFALILAWHKTHRPIWWYSCVTLLIIACLWDVARTGKPVCDCTGCSTSIGEVSFAKGMKIDSTFQIGENHITSNDEMTNMYLTLLTDSLNSLRNELALRDTADYISEHSKIEP